MRPLERRSPLTGEPQCATMQDNYLDPRLSQSKRAALLLETLTLARSVGLPHDVQENRPLMLAATALPHGADVVIPLQARL